MSLTYLEKSDILKTISKPMEKIKKTDTDWKKQLTEQEYYVTRKQGTERAFTGEYNSHYEKGTYTCVCCGSDLFSSKHKFDSGTGWPSFYQPVAKNSLEEREDNSFFSKRTEVVCAKCEAHLGHLFPDGPKPTGIRYCINSTSLNFKNEK
jgi:peptide-methionine (R)-S-oxide reductase